MNEVISTQIHHTAIVDPSVKIGENVQIGAYCRIGPGVKIGDNTVISSHVVIDKFTSIGKNNKIYSFASVGIDPQDYNKRDEAFILEIGDFNIIREYVTISRGTSYGGGITKLGNNNLIMAYSHIAHDCIIGSNVILSNNATLAGHVIVGNNAVLSGFSGSHQFGRIGEHAFLGMRCTVNQDVAPYMLVAGAEPSVRGINSVGLKRRGFTEEVLKALKNSYKILYRNNLKLKDACTQIHSTYGHFDEVKKLLDFVSKSERGLLR